MAHNTDGGRPRFRGLPPESSCLQHGVSPIHQPVLMQIAFTLYLIVLFPGGARRDECRDLAERERVQGRSGDRIRAPKQSGAVSFILLPVRAKVRFRVTMTSPRPRSDVLKPHFGSSCAPGIASLAGVVAAAMVDRAIFATVFTMLGAFAFSRAITWRREGG